MILMDQWKYGIHDFGFEKQHAQQVGPNIH